MAAEDSEQNALEGIISKLGSMKSKDDISNFFSNTDGNSIKSIINYFLNRSPSESTELLQKLINSGKIGQTKSSFPWIHYGVSLELTIAGLLMVFQPKLFLQIFQLNDIENEKYDYLRTTGLVVIVLGIHYFFQARNRVNPLIQIAAWVRVVACFAFAYFVSKGWVEKPVMVFGITDFLTGLLQIKQSKL